MKRKALKIVCCVLTLAVIGGSPIIPASGGLAIVAEAHSGQSGSCGIHHGHRGTGRQGNTAETQAEFTTGWSHDGCGWQYRDDKNTCKQNGLYEIDGTCYLFDKDGYRMTGWQSVDENWCYFDENGCMLTDTCTYIDGSYCHFDEHGKWDGHYYDGCEEHRQACTHGHHN